MPEAYLITRGHERKLEYDFLGPVPPAFWWSPLSERRLVDLNQAEVMAHGDGRSLSVLVSGIPSARLDFVGRGIRHTLVVDGLHDDAELALELVRAGLAAAGRESLGRRLDEAFDEQTIVAVRTGASSAAVVSERLTRALLAGPGPGAPGATAGGPLPADQAGSWAGPAGDDDARALFLARVRALAAGAPGFACTSCLAQTATAIEADIEGLPGTQWVLVTGGRLAEVVPLGKALPAITGTRSSLSTRLATRPRAVAATGATVTALIVIVIVILLLL
ncbi:MAG TPA: hypothetical protein VH478_12990 [Trebonia sp.]|jgi:hypothetical protein|nr:hypothetical protein [Trebonia sp.]